MKLYLNDILARKEKEITHLIKNDLQLIQSEKSHKKSLSHMLKTHKHGIIAEIKRASPSKGFITELEPIIKAKEYIQGDCCAISVLTDQGFNGSLADLNQVSDALHNVAQPILRKDFILSPIQIIESYNNGADIILLIVKILGQRTIDMLSFAEKLGLEVIVEVHDQKELDIALTANAKIIGVNQRNLADFSLHYNQFHRLIQHIPKSIIKIAESGIKETEQAKELFDCGYNAILVGETLVKSSNPALLIQQMRGIHV